MKQSKFALLTQQLTVCYHQRPVIWDIDLQIPKGHLVAIVGPNGAGKSTLLKAILDLVPRLTGHIELLGEPLGRVRKKVSYVPQRESVDWDFPITVGQLAMMGRYGHLGWLRRPGSLDRALVERALEQVGLKELCERQIGQLSGGQQQRAFIARALAQQAELYFLDEPFAAVDQASERQLVEVLRHLARDGSTLFVVHHDLSTLKAYFDWVILLNTRLIASGPTESVVIPELLEQAYGRSVVC